MINRSYIKGHEGHPHYFSNPEILSFQKITYFSPKEAKLVSVLRNLSDPTRLKIWLLLHQIKEISVNDLGQILNLSQSAVSHALADLKNLKLVESHRCGQFICYSLSPDGEKQLEWLRFFGGRKNETF